MIKLFDKMSAVLLKIGSTLSQFVIYTSEIYICRNLK